MLNLPLLPRDETKARSSSVVSREPILVLANPHSGSGRGRRARLLEAVKRELEKQGSRVHIGIETDPTAIRQRAENAARAGAPVVVAAGGDGTVNAVANGLLRASRGRPGATRLGVLPLGTGNVFAYNLNIGRNWREAVRTLVRGEVRRIDVGCARALPGARSLLEKESSKTPSPRYFLLMAGLGFDAQVIEETSLRMKTVLRDFAYATTALQNAVSHRGAQVSLHFPDGTHVVHPAWMLMAGNAASYAWAIRFTKQARLDDGLLDLCLFPFENKLSSVNQVAQLLLGQHVERGAAQYWQVPRVEIRATPRIPVQLDGDEWGTTPVELSIVPGALEVVAPSGLEEG